MPFDPAQLLRAYRAERRLLELPAYRREDLDCIVRYTPTDAQAEGIVCFSELDEGEVDLEIARQQVFFADHAPGFEWKVYGADRPATLAERLRASGFEAGDPEVLMVFDLRAARQCSPTAAPAGVDLRRLDEPEQLRAVVALQEEIYDRPFSWLLDSLRRIWKQTDFHGAWADGALVGAGWVEYSPGSHFAELHGGSVLPAWRRRGLYSRLLARRFDDAERRGMRWVVADSAPMSQPILRGRGFQKLDDTVPFTWRP